MKTREKVS